MATFLPLTNSAGFTICINMGYVREFSPYTTSEGVRTRLEYEGHDSNGHTYILVLEEPGEILHMLAPKAPQRKSSKRKDS